MDLIDGRLVLSRELSTLDRDVVEFTSVLDDHSVEYVIVSGYVSILTGRSRSTEDVDVVLEPLDSDELSALADRFERMGYWGMAMPLDRLSDMLPEGERLRIAEDGVMVPNFEVWLASNDLEREALATSITAEIGDAAVSISGIELQIAYKLQLAQAAGSTAGKDFEDALHLYLTFEDQLNTDRLETYVEDLAVEDYYDQLRGN
ncbi:hypothetical protein GCM10028857_29730 [Salinarchaeum chitinilyticum]